MNNDGLQNQLILVTHHLEDAIKGLKDGDITYVKKSLLDIAEVVSKLAADLPEDVKAEIVPSESEIEKLAAEIPEVI